MSANIQRRLAAFHDANQKRSLEKLFQPAIDGSITQTLTSAGLAITGAGGTTAKIGATDVYAIVDGVLVKIAAATAMPALTGLNQSAGVYNVYVFFTDGAGNLSVKQGLEAAAIGNIKWPAFPSGLAPIGFLLVTYASAFTGGTTPLDTATTVYLNPVGDWYPSLMTDGTL
jgi:hypothetical protein